MLQLCILLLGSNPLWVPSWAISKPLHPPCRPLQRRASLEPMVVTAAAMANDLETQLISLCASSSRGQEMPTVLQDRVSSLVNELELLYQDRLPSDAVSAMRALEGSWELIYSSEPLFLATPFWWGIGELLRASAGVAAASGAFGVVRALSEGPMLARYGRILQRIAGDTLVSDVDIGLFGALNVTLLTEATLGGSGEKGELSLSLKQTRVLGSPFPGLDDLEIPVEAALGGVAAAVGAASGDGVAPLPLIRAVHVGERLRVSKLQGSSQISIFKRLDE